MNEHVYTNNLLPGSAAESWDELPNVKEPEGVEATVLENSTK
jgi:hypothetical protein